ncbi:MAG: glycosyl hydrolase [Saprospiraceae bacterium]|nr:glycosyl hydrolase [Saprospiraceae bacterium]
MKKVLFLLILVFLCQYTEGVAQRLDSKTTTSSIDASMLKFAKWRNVGPFRGGRSLAVTGVADQPLTYYFGATGGGVWKTTDGGMGWRNISDSTFKSSSVGSIAIAPSDANVLYVGMGETDIRGNIAGGDGIYKTTDAGKSWKHVGLKKSWGVGKLVVHPKNADVVLVAALGNPFGRVSKPMNSEERGVYRSTDGGATWQQVIAPTNDKTGALDVTFDPTNPSIAYATMWECYRNQYSMSSGGEGSGFYKSTDGGATWKNISKNVGLPVGLLGKMGVSVSPINGNRVWAIVENANGGLFKSDDGGETWTRTSNDKNIWQRPWYYMQVVADPASIDAVYALNVNLMYSNDGGKNFRQMQVGHGDTHDLWINPKNPQNLILGDDGGAEVSFNQGKTWTELDIPTCQFYHISLDNAFPYHLYGAQQDNSSIRIESRNTDGAGLTRNNWEVAGGGESGYVVSDPLNSDIVFGGNYMGQMERWNLRTGQKQDVSANPIQYLGDAAEAMKYRFQWTFPIVFSPHDPKTLYVTSQYVHKSTNYGQSWDIISPDLSRHDTSTIKSSGGLITKDNTGAETFADIFTFAESPVKQGVFWAGSDDGFMHVSQDNGKNWTKCDIKGLPEWALMSMVEVSHFDAGTAYLAANRYKLDDTKPYLFRTRDFGKTWTKITEGLPDGAFCRVIREDPNKQGLLYAGTETGIFVSLNDGATWLSFQGNLPLTPIHDLQIQAREKDLCVATHGRAFWIMDNLEPIYQLYDLQQKGGLKTAHIFKPESAWRVGGSAFNSPAMQIGENAPNGVLINYFLKEKPKDEVQLRFISERGDTIITYSSTKDKKGKALDINKDFYQKEKIERAGIAAAESGMNTFLWDMRYPDATDTEGSPAMMWSGSVTGPKVAPGKYNVEMVVGKNVVGKQPFEIKKDPRAEVSDAALAENVNFQLKVRDKLSETHKSINELRQIRKSVNDYMATLEVKDSLFKKELEVVSKPMLEQLQSVEDALIQHKAKAFQDLLALPIRLNDKIAGMASVAASADTPLTAQNVEGFTDLAQQADVQIIKLNKVIESEVPKFNQIVEKRKTPAISIKPKVTKP